MICAGKTFKAATRTNNNPNAHMTPGRIRALITLKGGECYQHYDIPKQQYVTNSCSYMSLDETQVSNHSNF